MAHENETVVWLHARQRVSIVDLSQSSGLAEEVLRELAECGALPPADPGAREFAADLLPAVRAAARLCADLELDAPALPVVLGLLRRIEGLEADLRELRARLVRPRP